MYFSAPAASEDQCISQHHYYYTRDLFTRRFMPERAQLWVRAFVSGARCAASWEWCQCCRWIRTQKLPSQEKLHQEAPQSSSTGGRVAQGEEETGCWSELRLVLKLHLISANIGPSCNFDRVEVNLSWLLRYSFPVWFVTVRVPCVLHRSTVRSLCAPSSSCSLCSADRCQTARRCARCFSLCIRALSGSPKSQCQVMIINFGCVYVSALLLKVSVLSRTFLCKS